MCLFPILKRTNIDYTYSQTDTINKLLKRQAPKQRRTRLTEGEGTPLDQDAEPEKANDVFVRWISNRDGIAVGVPEEWLGTPVGRVFELSQRTEPMSKKVKANA